MVNLAPIRTLEGTIAWEVARLGISRHSPSCDWSGGYNVDDCALFQSTAVFGQKVAWNVDVFSRLSGGTYHAGSGGIQRGDVLLYGWTPGHFDHTEMALGAPVGGVVKTIGSNGSDTIAVAYRSRPIGYVTGYFRPAYQGGTSPASTTSPAASSNPAVFTPAAPAASNVNRKAKSMWHIYSTSRGAALVGSGYFHPLTPEEDTVVAPAYKAAGLDVEFGSNDRAFDLFKAAHTQPGK